MTVLSVTEMELIQDYQLFMTVKVEFVQVMKKDSLIAQEVNLINITVLIVKILLFIVVYMNKNMLDQMVNGLVCLHSTSLNLLKMDNLLVHSYSMVVITIGELCVMTS